jgi:chorismate dehydratase
MMMKRYPWNGLEKPRQRPERLRLGAVQYLNTKPLIHGLAGHVDSLVFDLPSRLADALGTGGLDVALIPVVELFSPLRAGYRVVSDACIACRGPVMSVKIFFRTRPEAVRRFAVDEGSRTSVALGRVLLAERFGVRPAIEILPIGAGVDDTDADAVLLIGDRAIGSASGSFQVIWDLGDEWFRWQGLPFVFAVWAARPGVEPDSIAPLLAGARDAGRQQMAAIAAAEAPRHGLTVEQCLGYLRDSLHYELGDRERVGLERFRRFVAMHVQSAADAPASSPQIMAARRDTR